jgi:hypothetical protein
MSFNDNLGFLLNKEIHNDSSDDYDLNETNKELKYIYRCFNALTLLYNKILDVKDIYILDINIDYITILLEGESEYDNNETIKLMKLLFNNYIMSLISKSKIFNDNIEDIELIKFINLLIYNKDYIIDTSLPVIKISEVKKILCNLLLNLNFNNIKEKIKIKSYTDESNIINNKELIPKLILKLNTVISSKITGFISSRWHDSEDLF